MSDAPAAAEKGRSVADGPAPAAATATATMSKAEVRRGGIGWIRGIASGVVIVAVSFVLVVLLPNAVLTGSFTMARDPRGVLAFVIAVVLAIAIATGLRRLQAKGLI